MEMRMKKVCLMLFVLLVGCAAFAQNSQTVTWRNMQGVITAPNVNNPIANINSGTFPWTVDHGSARVSLSSGSASFILDGLVLNGSASSGTAGPVTRVVGTLVCNPGTHTQTALDTPSVRLNPQGDAIFSGQISNIPATCANPLFLIRIAVPTGAAGFWIATGVERFFD
jgi:hypothetical protein